MSPEITAFIALVASLLGIAYKLYSISKDNTDKGVKLEQRLSSIERKLDLNDERDKTLMEKLDELKSELKDSRVDSKLIERRLTDIEIKVGVMKT